MNLPEVLVSGCSSGQMPVWSIGSENVYSVGVQAWYPQILVGHPELGGACWGKEPQTLLGHPKSWKEVVCIPTEGSEVTVATTGTGGRPAT